MADATTTVINLRLNDRLLAKVEDYRFRNRFPSRHEALLFLLQYALAENPKPEPAK